MHCIRVHNTSQDKIIISIRITSSKSSVESIQNISTDYPNSQMLLDRENDLHPLIEIYYWTQHVPLSKTANCYHTLFPLIRSIYNYHYNYYHTPTYDKCIDDLFIIIFDAFFISFYNAPFNKINHG